MDSKPIRGRPKKFDGYFDRLPVTKEMHTRLFALAKEKKMTVANLRRDIYKSALCTLDKKNKFCEGCVSPNCTTCPLEKIMREGILGEI